MTIFTVREKEAMSLLSYNFALREQVNVQSNS